MKYAIATLIGSIFLIGTALAVAWFPNPKWREFDRFGYPDPQAGVQMRCAVNIEVAHDIDSSGISIDVERLVSKYHGDMARAIDSVPGRDTLVCVRGGFDTPQQ